MDLTPYVDRFRADLAIVAEAAGAEARGTAERLAAALEPALRMALLEALSDAAAEVTAGLGGGAVDVRMKGREPQLVVTSVDTRTDANPDQPADRSAEDDAEEGAVARITVRIPEGVKVRAEQIASQRGQSLNAWIVQALRLATRERAVDVDIDLGSWPISPGTGFGPRRSRRAQGWVR